MPKRPGASVAVIDDVVTSGGSIRFAITAVEEAGFKVAKVIYF